MNEGSYRRHPHTC